MTPLVEKGGVLSFIAAWADAIAENKEYLTELDAKIGDADHGINMDRGLNAVREKLDTWRECCIGTVLKNVGMTLVSKVGGASGPLYGTAFMYAGAQLTGKETLGLSDLRAAFQAALDGIVKRGRACVGDKTMVDTLAPVVAFLNSDASEGKPLAEVLSEAAEIAKRGMESTRELTARKGRASFLGERSRGHLDPGAVSSYLLVQAAADQF